MTNGVLEVAHSIFARWRPLFQSNELNREVLHVVETFGDPFIQMLSVRETSPVTAALSQGADDCHPDRSRTKKSKRTRTMRLRSRAGSRP